MDDGNKVMPIAPSALETIKRMSAEVEVLRAQLQTYVRGVADSMALSGNYAVDLDAGVFRERSIDTEANGTVPERKEPITDAGGTT
jgi:hypothetical protein